MASDPTVLWALADDLLGVVADALADVLPPGYRHDPDQVGVVNGPPAIDGWVGYCAEHLVAWWEGVGATRSFPLPLQGALGDGCAPPEGSVVIVVQSLRCEPQVDAAGRAPSVAELDRAARLVAVDAAVTWAAVTCWALAMADDPDDVEVALVGQVPVPPMAGIAGVETRLIVQIAPVCCGEGGPEFAPLPDGFLPE